MRHYRGVVNLHLPRCWWAYGRWRRVLYSINHLSTSSACSLLCITLLRFLWFHFGVWTPRPVIFWGLLTLLSCLPASTILFSRWKKFLRYLLPLEEDVSSASSLSIGFSLYVWDETEITMCYFAGEGWLATSQYMTKFQLSDSVGNVLSTHSKLVLNLLSFSFENLAFLVCLVIVAYAFI